MAHDATERAAEKFDSTERAAEKFDATESNAVERDAPGRDERERSRQSKLRTWTVLALVLGSLVGIPLVVLAETEFGLLSSLGLPRELTLGVLALVPGFALGGLSLVVMTGWE